MKNVSDRQLSQAEKAILKKELSFHGKTNPASETNNRDKICIVKQFLWLANVEQLQMKVAACLRNAKPPTSNTSMKKRKTRVIP